ncbi:hypothetical protein [uncultured Bacteroides sp.]|uniref:hypothetical protein n=1 Tax=uncultured Bacteroides sp. TaxID=162156 RepID=UPI00262E7F4B|nr:hypothetical protein [uncultured Bacteroides sp.]
MKQILNDWQGLFPALSPYTPSTLYTKADFVLMGLRLEKVMSDTYRVILECLPLWEQDKSSMKIPVFSWELYDKKGMQFFIKTSLHEHLFPTAAGCAEEQFGALLKENILAGDLCRCIRKASATFANWHRILTFKLVLATYLNDARFLAEVRQEIETETGHWDSDRFAALFRKSKEEWKADLYRRFEDREALLERIQTHMDDKKIARLKPSHILL